MGIASHSNGSINDTLQHEAKHAYVKKKKKLRISDESNQTTMHACMQSSISQNPIYFAARMLGRPAGELNWSGGVTAASASSSL